MHRVICTIFVLQCWWKSSNIWSTFKPIDSRAFCQKSIFWTFWRFSGWIQAKLAPVYSKRHLQHDSMLFFPLASCFMTFLLGHVHISKFWAKKVTYVFRLFIFFFCHSFPYLFAAMNDLLPSLLLAQNHPRKHHWDRQFLSWSSHVEWQEILLWVKFHSNFWAFLFLVHIAGSI